MSERILREFVESLAKIRLKKWCNKNNVEEGDLVYDHDRTYIRLVRRAARKALELAEQEQCPRTSTCPYFAGDHCNHSNVMMTTATLRKKAEEEQAAEPTEEEMKTMGYKISVMQAAEAGANIEKANWGHDNWSDCLPMWNWGCVKYRVKPRPIEGWINEYPHMNDICVTMHTSPERADGAAEPDRIRRVHMREVVE